MAATDASGGIGATTGASHGIGATTGVPAKSLLGMCSCSSTTGGRVAMSLLGNRFVGQPPPGRAAARADAEERHHHCTWNQSAASGGNRNRSRYGYPWLPCASATRASLESYPDPP